MSPPSHLNFSGLTIDANSEECMREQIAELLTRLRPDWSADGLKFNKYTDGITNTVLCVQSRDDDEKLVFRVFGNGTENIIDRKNELVNFELLSQHGLSPPVHATFKNGFVCGFLPGETLDVESVRDPAIVPKICQQLATLHRIPVQPPKTSFLFEKLQQFLDNIPQRFHDPQKQRTYEKYFGDVDFKGLLENIHRIVESAENTKQVLCHNDLLINNILYDSEKDEIHFIDFEYMAANYQLFDIANHFNEYPGVETPDYKRLPSDEEKYTFVKIYLRFYLDREPTASEIDEIMVDIPKFQAVSHLFWIVWSFVQANSSSIDFDYLAYAHKRYGQYLEIVRELKF